jgi:aspartyl-tRNA(Asn)/glutamyl-tRNA(Gln) amidotransferase subunit A
VGPFSLGSDGGGSVRIPASFCGLYGIKPTMGRVPLYPGTKDHRYPGVSSWESLEHIGPLTRTVADAALVLSVIAGYDDRDRLSVRSDDVDWRRAVDGDLRGVRVAYSPDLGYAAVDPAVRTVIDQAVTVFERDLGCTVERADPGWEDPYEALLPLIVCESDLAGLRRLADELGERMSPHLVDVLRLDWSAEQLTSAVVRRKAVYNAAWRFFRSYDLLVTPTLAVPPFEHGLQGPPVIDGREVEAFYWLSFTFPFNFTGQPAATVPAGFTQDGLPIGLQIVGRRLDDALVLRASAAYEAAAPWRDRWPAVPAERGWEQPPIYHPQRPGQKALDKESRGLCSGRKGTQKRLSLGSWVLRWGPPPEREHGTLPGPPSPRRRTPDARLAHARCGRRDDD